AETVCLGQPCDHDDLVADRLRSGIVAVENDHVDLVAAVILRGERARKTGGGGEHQCGKRASGHRNPRSSPSTRARRREYGLKRAGMSGVPGSDALGDLDRGSTAQPDQTREQWISGGVFGARGERGVAMLALFFAEFLDHSGQFRIAAVRLELVE